MLSSVGNMLTATTAPSLIRVSCQNPSSQFFHFPSKTHKFNLLFLSHLPTHQVSSPLCSGFRLNSNKNGDSSADSEDFDVFDDEGEFVPLRSMKKWLEEKPRGFGEGKEYDTLVEDKLLDEMQQSREAQLANINKLKNTFQISNPKIEASLAIPAGSRVRLSNLPRKKNIDRDLQRAFKGIPGIVNISPAVSGNKKTRDPVCKGFAFVDLKTLDYAHRFAQVVSGQSISFGKIEKQIKCEVMSSKAQNSAPEQSVDTEFGASDISSDSLNSISSEESVETNENVGNVNMLSTNESVTGLKSSKQVTKVGVKEKKQEAKQKRPKVPKLNVPGSANRLKVREKAMLSGVLSKYAATS